MAKFRAEKITSIARYDLPASLAREIGRFLATWAHFEHYVQALVWAALELGAEAGRVAVREPRVTERLDMVRDLTELSNTEMDFILLSEIRKRADLSPQRDTSSPIVSGPTTGENGARLLQEVLGQRRKTTLKITQLEARLFNLRPIPSLDLT